MSSLLSSSDPLLWIHIPKTGGTTLKRIVEREYADDTFFYLDRHWLIADASDGAPFRFTRTDGEHMRVFGVDPVRAEIHDRPALHLIQGHFPWGLHDDLDLAPQYAVVLRNPVDRILSEFHHAKRLPQHFLHDAVQDMSVSEYVEASLSVSVDNAQVRFLAGCYHEVPIGEITREDFEIALQNLRRTVIAGTTEQMAAVLSQCVTQLGWKTRHCILPKQRASKQRTRLPDDDLATLLDRNQYDAMLWSCAYHSTRHLQDWRALVIENASLLYSVVS